MDLAEIPLGRVQKRIVDRLARHLGHWVPTDALIDAAYVDDEDGGPLNAEACLRATVHVLRIKLKRYGYSIEGVSFAGRRLVRL